MKKIVGAFSTEIKMSHDEAIQICRLNQGEKCCAFLVLGGDGFSCIRMAYPSNTTIFDRLKKGTMNAKGEGGWEGCAWEDDINNEHDKEVKNDVI